MTGPVVLHVTDVEQREVPRAGGDLRDHKIWRWVAFCSCGWEGTQWDTMLEATIEALEHDREKG